MARATIGDRVRPLAVRVAVVVFFIMAALGFLCGLPTETCAYRAMVGAVVFYVMTLVVGHIVVGAVSGAVVSTQIMPDEAEGSSSGNRKQ